MLINMAYIDKIYIDNIYIYIIVSSFINLGFTYYSQKFIYVIFRRNKKIVND